MQRKPLHRKLPCRVGLEEVGGPPFAEEDFGDLAGGRPTINQMASPRDGRQFPKVLATITSATQTSLKSGAGVPDGAKACRVSFLDLRVEVILHRNRSHRIIVK